jgi:hypothetical protein
MSDIWCRCDFGCQRVFRIWYKCSAGGRCCVHDGGDTEWCCEPWKLASGKGAFVPATVIPLVHILSMIYEEELV